MTRSFISTQMFSAVSMTRGKYCLVREWDLPDTENPRDRGFMVTYPDGHQTWIPKAQFEASTIELPNIKGLEPYQQRLLGERAQLHDRLSKLTDAMKKPTYLLIPHLDQELLLSQSRAMAQYLAKLDKRIALFYQDKDE